MEPGFMEFDPCTEMGRLRWNQLVRLLRCRMKLPTCRLAQIRDVKARWLQHLQGAEDVDRFLSDDEQLHEFNLLCLLVALILTI